MMMLSISRRKGTLFLTFLEKSHPKNYIHLLCFLEATFSGAKIQSVIDKSTKLTNRESVSK